MIAEGQIAERPRVIADQMIWSVRRTAGLAEPVHETMFPIACSEFGCLS
jgi:hypothetical protein